MDDWEAIKDSKVKLYTGRPVQNKRVNIHHRQELVETEFRLVVIKNENQNKKFWFMTNDFELSAKEIADYYRKRWDIEVFFQVLSSRYSISAIWFRLINYKSNLTQKSKNCQDYSTMLLK